MRVLICTSTKYLYSTHSACCRQLAGETLWSVAIRGRYGDSVVFGLGVAQHTPPHTMVSRQANGTRGLQAKATDNSTRRYHSSIRTTYKIRCYDAARYM